MARRDLTRRRSWSTIYPHTTATSMPVSDQTALSRPRPMTRQSSPYRPDLACLRSGWSSRPGQVNQDHNLLGWENPIGQQPSSATKAHRPPGTPKAAPAKPHAGLGRIHPKDREDASKRAGQQGRGVAESLVDRLRDEDL